MLIFIATVICVDFDQVSNHTTLKITIVERAGFRHRGAINTSKTFST